MASKKYIENMIDGYHNLSGEKPTIRYKPPLENRDYPGLDQSNFLDESDIKKY